MKIREVLTFNSPEVILNLDCRNGSRWSPSDCGRVPERAGFPEREMFLNLESSWKGTKPERVKNEYKWKYRSVVKSWPGFDFSPSLFFRPTVPAGSWFYGGCSKSSFWWSHEPSIRWGSGAINLTCNVSATREDTWSYRKATKPFCCLHRAFSRIFLLF